MSVRGNVVYAIVAIGVLLSGTARSQEADPPRAAVAPVESRSVVLGVTGLG